MLKKILFAGVILSSFMSVYATGTTLSLSNSGTTGSVIVTVTGAANSAVSLSYYSTVSTGIQTQNIGTTNSDGTFWTIVSTQAYNISSNGNVYVTVGGQQSPSMVWPYTNGTSASGVFSLSQTGVVLYPGQTTSLTATNGLSMYLFNNTNPAVVNVSISGSQINISANSNGSTVFTVCSGSSSNCVSVYVTVQNSSSQLLTFSQSNVTITTGQTLPISIYGGSGVYTVVSNSNSGTIQTSLSGSTINLYGNSGSGQSSITVCTTNMASCGIINATIGTTSSSAVTFGQTSPTVSIGQTLPVSITGSSGTYSISSNSNANSVQASISGSSLTLLGISYGSSNIIICSSTGSCASLLVTVSNGGGGGAIALSQTSVVLVTGQTVGISISGGSVPYSVTSGTTGIVQTSLNNNILTLNAVASGSTSVNVCSSGGGCITLSVVVNNSIGGTSISATPGFSQSTVSLVAGQSSTVSIIGSGGYYLAGNSNSGVANATISGSNIVITGNTSGSTSITVCQSTSQCNVISINVSGSVTSVTAPVINPIISVGQKINFVLSGGTSYYLSSSQNSYFTAVISGNNLAVLGTAIGVGQISVCSSSSTCTTFSITVNNSNNAVVVNNSNAAATVIKYLFNKPLTYGDKGDDVIELQKRLHEEGYFNGSYVARYGDATLAAVKKYQKAHGLTQIGNLGPATRALLNK